MGYQHEIERKFLVIPEKLPPLLAGKQLLQGYLSFTPVVRVRIETAPETLSQAYLTIKGPGLVGREEFEYLIPLEEGQALLKLSQASLVSKTRYLIPVEGSPQLKWELDIFEGDNEGLMVAELEVPSLDVEVASPEWLGQEVTTDKSYKNAALALRPFKVWGKLFLELQETQQ